MPEEPEAGRPRISSAGAKEDEDAKRKEALRAAQGIADGEEAAPEEARRRGP